MTEDSLIQRPKSDETERCWSDLPPEVLSLILSRLFFKDHRRFKLVCKSWSMINPVMPPCLDSPHFDSPCLMLSPRGSFSWKLFHSLYDEFYHLDFPELMGAEIHFFKDGWLLMSRDKCPLFFFNPFTKQKFELPPVLADPPSFFSVCFTSPPTSSDCFVFGILATCVISELEFGLIKFGDPEWKIGPFHNGRDKFWASNCPPLFHNGVFYCLDSRARYITKFDPTKEDEYQWKHFAKCRETIKEEEEKADEEEEEEDEEVEEQEEGGGDDYDDEVEEEVEEGNDEEEEEEDDDDDDIVHEMYMVEVDGGIWGVFVKNYSGEVSVEKLDLSEMRWKKLENLGEKCLYVSMNGSFAETCVVSNMANKIYFNKFDGQQHGIMYCLSSKMYHSVLGNFASKEFCGLAHMDYGTWIKHSRGSE